MVKRATIHVSSRTKMNHPKNEGIRAHPTNPVE